MINHDREGFARSYRRRDVMNIERIYPVIVEYQERPKGCSEWPVSLVVLSSVSYMHSGVSGIGEASMELLQYFNNGGPLA